MKLNVKNYIERDISWMYFNKRILDEALRKDIPLMERLTMLGIYSNNLDEFFRVRVATLNRIVEYADKSERSLKNRSEETLKRIHKLNAKYNYIYSEAIKEVEKALSEEHIFIPKNAELDESQQEFVKEYCLTNLAGNISPIWLNNVKNLVNSADDNIYLAIRLQKLKEGKKKPSRDYAVLELPVRRFGRFVELPTQIEENINEDGVAEQTTNHYVMYLDDVVRCALPYMFTGVEFDEVEAWSFKFTRDAEMEIESDVQNGTLQKIAKGVKSRKHGLPVRMIYDAEMPKELQRRIKDTFGATENLIAGGRYQNHKDLMKFPDCGRKDLCNTKWTSIVPDWAKDVLNGQNSSLIDKIREKDRFLHVPYHSFDAYIHLLREAAINPEVKCIKTTLYRLAKDSKVIGALIAAAKNGKKVTVVIELLARFDEESNIDWSRKMAEAGINVITGVEGLKIHSKITLIECLRHDISVISTGNFHEGNARAYTDFMLMTDRKAISHDVARVFQFIEHPYMPPRFHELLVSPNDMKYELIKLINHEIKNYKMGIPSGILCKLNHITDEEIVKKLYEAAVTGVKVRLLVRGNCSLVTTLPELRGNIEIHGIIDRYLEHSRILVFANGTDLEHPEILDGSQHDYKVFIGSADWMPRNLDHRIEVYTPVYDPEIKREARLIVEYGLKDNVQARIVDGSGANLPICKDQDAEVFQSQKELFNHYNRN